MERRQCDRVPVEYAASFLADGLINGHGAILELSVAGCRIRSSFAVKQDDCLKMLIDVPRYGTPLHVAMAAVRWSNGQEFGMEFIQMGPAERRQLLELLHAIKAARRGEKNKH